MRHIEKKKTGPDDVIFKVRHVIKKWQLSISVVNVTYVDLIKR